MRSNKIIITLITVMFILVMSAGTVVAQGNSKHVPKQNIEKRKEQLMRTLDVMTKHMQRSRDRIEASERFGVERRKVLLDEIDARLNAMVAARLKTNAIVDLDEFKAMHTDIRILWTSFGKLEVRKPIVLHHIGNVEKTLIDRTQKRADLIEDMLDLYQGDANIESLRNDLQSARRIVDSAYKTLSGLQASLNDFEPGDETLKEIKKSMKEVHTNLIKAYDLLRSIVFELNR